PIVISDKPTRKRIPKIKGKAFLHGPVPMPWIDAADRLGRHVLRVGMQLWFIAGCEKTLEIKTTRARIAKHCTISRDVVGRAFAKLRKAGLIGQQHKPGSSSTITLIPEPLQLSIPFNSEDESNVDN